MPSQIRALPDNVVNQIAAGEVVERPASVVKELLENSLDAGASRIEVSIRNGGKSFIEVTDDGHGMGPDDALLAFERHATSKIQSANDLKMISTLGFRGEALSSISAVSRLRIATAVNGASEGVEIIMDGGVLREVRSCPPITGSRIQINSLFYNIPARRKFLRTEKVEAARIHETVARQALGSPGVSFKLIRDGQTIFDLPASDSGDSFEGRVAPLFGAQVAQSLAKVDHSYAGMSLFGLVSKPGSERNSRDAQHVFINGRYVRDRLLFHAIGKGYRSLAPKGRYPAVFLRLTMAPERVDVNVSPTKTEVRFADSGSIIELVREGISRGLAMAKGMTIYENRQQGDSEPSNERTWQNKPFHTPTTLQEHGATLLYKHPETEAVSTDEQPTISFDAGGAKSVVGLMDRADSNISEGFRAVGQIFNTFIIIEDGDKVLLLDQHTAHERVNYERLVDKHSQGRVESQELLFPVNLELSKTDYERVFASLGYFNNLGFSLEDFGGQTVTIRAVPALLGSGDHGSLILDILDNAGEIEGIPDFSRLAESAINIMACRSSVMAGQKLDQREISALVDDLKKCRLPYTCPHGRPVAMTITENELLKEFMRK